VTAPTWTVLVYAIADDEDDEAAVRRAVDDMRAALWTDRCSVIVQLHGPAVTTRYTLAAAYQPPRCVEGARDRGHGASLQDLLDTSCRAFPARSTALIVWAHGRGLDEVTTGFPARGDRGLGHVAIHRAIADSARGAVDLLGLNACWMGMLEVGYQLRDVATVAVASQVFALPWPYRRIVESLSRAPARSPRELATTIVSLVRDEIAADGRCDAVSAFLAGAPIAALADAVDRFAACATASIRADWPAVHAAVTTGAQRTDDVYQRDLASIVRVLGRGDVATEAAACAVAAALDGTLLASAANASFHPGLGGLSIFCPVDPTVDLATAYRGIDFGRNRWLGFLTEMQARLRAPSR
jgi:hypothetical protein